MKRCGKRRKLLVALGVVLLPFLFFALSNIFSATAYATQTQVVVDDLDPGFTWGGPGQWYQGYYSPGMHSEWQSTSFAGQIYYPPPSGHIYWTWNNNQYGDPAYNLYGSNWGVWRPYLPVSGKWRVEVYLSFNFTDSARYQIHHRDGVDVQVRAQHGPGGIWDPINNWVELGTYDFNAGTQGYVYLDDVTGEPAGARCVMWDAVRFTLVSAEDYRISITPPSATNLVGDSETFSVLLETTTDGVNWSPASGKTINLSIDSPAYFVTIGGLPASGQSGSGTTNGSGQLEVVVKSDSPTVATLNATFDELLSNQTLFSRSDTATKTWEDYRLLVDQTSATNLIGDPHTFTYTLQIDTGEGWTNVGAGYLLSFSVTSPAYFTDTLTQTTTKTTNASGQAQVTVNSNLATVATLSGSYNFSETVSFDAPPVTKTWLDYRISITPPSATNLVGETETFTVLLEVTTNGTTWSPASGETIDLSIDSPAYFVTIGGLPASGQSGSGTTDTNGQLAVVVKSNDPTVATLNATFDELLSNETLFTRSAPATKTWLARASVSGFKFDDRDTNGIWDKDKDQGEPSLSDWAITLEGTAINGEKVGPITIKTDAIGYYEFKDLPPGDYILTEEVRDLIINPDGSVVEPGWFNTVAPPPIHLNPGDNKTDQNFGNKQYGWIWGRVYDAISDVGIGGVRIDLLETEAYTTTNETGYYYFYKLIPNETTMFPSPTYTVEITLPTNYWSPQVSREVTVENGKGTQVDWLLWPSPPTGESPRTIGYWKNWDNHYTREQMEVMIAWVKVTSGLFPDLTVDNLKTHLTMTKYSTMQDKARAQLIATWLNIASHKLGMGQIVDLSPIANWSQVITTPDGSSLITIYDLIQQIDNYFKTNGLTATLWEIIKNILDALNNGLLFLSGG